MKPIETPHGIHDGIAPGVREFVAWLNGLGFVTTDSGDGSNHAAGMECAMPFANVYVVCEPAKLIEEADRLRAFMANNGVTFEATGEGAPMMQAMYSPVDGGAGILITGIDDKAMGYPMSHGGRIFRGQP